MSRSRPRSRSLFGLLVAGVVLGVFTLSPVAAHFSQNTKHLGTHAWKQFVRKKVFTKKQANRRFVNRRETAADSRRVNGAEILWARVDTDGSSATLVDGHRATFAGGGGEGVYFVGFDRPVTDCVKQVTAQEVRSPASTELEARHIFAYVTAVDPNFVDIRTYIGSTPTGIDGAANGFALTLIC